MRNGTRHGVGVLVALTMLVASAAAADRADEAVRRPHIVLLLADDMRWDLMGCEDHPVVQTPSLDRLASQGVLFTRSFCTTSICAVNRASLLTGQYASRHRVPDFATPVVGDAFAETFPAALRRAGYYSGFIGKWGLGGPLPKDQFDFWEGFAGQGKFFEKEGDEHLTARQADHALRFLADVPDGRPFFLWLSFKAPHVQDGAPREFPPDPRHESLYTDVKVPMPPTATPEAFAALPRFIQTSENRTRWQRRFATPEMHQATVKDHFRLITGLDEAVGRIMQALHDGGLAEQTVVIFTSDNGFFLGEHGLAGKWLMYEESIRVPLLIRGPGALSTPPGRRLDPMVLGIDVAPTIFELAGLPVPASVQGRSLKPLLLGERPAWRDEFFYEHHYEAGGRIPPSEGVRDHRWKYVRYVAADPPVEYLFDLKSDPREERNLAAVPEHRRQLDDMRQRWQRWRERVREQGRIEN